MLLQDLDNCRTNGYLTRPIYRYEVNLPNFSSVIKISQHGRSHIQYKENSVLVEIPSLKIAWVTSSDDHNALLLEIHSEIKARV